MNQNKPTQASSTAQRLLHRARTWLMDITVWSPKPTDDRYHPKAVVENQASSTSLNNKSSEQRLLPQSSQQLLRPSTIAPSAAIPDSTASSLDDTNSPSELDDHTQTIPNTPLLSRRPIVTESSEHPTELEVTNSSNKPTFTSENHNSSVEVSHDAFSDSSPSWIDNDSIFPDHSNYIEGVEDWNDGFESVQTSDNTIFDYDEDARQDPWEQHDDDIMQRAREKALQIVSQISSSTRRSDDDMLDCLTDLFQKHPHHPTFRAIKAAADDGVSSELLRNMISLREVWENHPEWWVGRYGWNGDVIPLQNGALALTWKLARLICERRSNFPPEEMISDPWLREWYNLSSASQYKTFPKYIHGKVTSTTEAFQDHSEVVDLKKSGLNWIDLQELGLSWVDSKDIEVDNDC